jgi:antibiotic biosynthesis monooxygenase (ABM) superfamily enzyme
MRSTMISISEDARQLKDYQLSVLFEDRENLDFWILSSKRIQHLYNDIKALI